MPVIPFLRKLLEPHAAREKHGSEDYIFARNRKRFVALLDNLTRRVIQPAVGTYGAVGTRFPADSVGTFWALGVDVGTVQKI